MEILYIISIIELFISIMLVKKKEEKINIIKNAIITTVLVMGINIAECHLLYYMKIKSIILVLGIINIIISTSLIIYSISKRKIQKYYLKKLEFIPILIFLIITIVVGYLNFGLPANIKFETSDPYMHCRAAIKFAQENTLIFNLEDNFCDFRYWMTASYINTGLLINTLSEIVNTIDYYMIYIVFELFIFWMSALVMYYTLKEFVKTRFSKIIAIICTILYILGYPLNSLLFGFSYLSIGILIINTIILFMEDYRKVNLKYFTIGLALLNFALFNAYYLFIPPVFLTEFIYILYTLYKNKQKIFTKSNILLIIVSMFIPGIIGCAQYVLRLLITNISGIANWGYIYTNVYSNMLIPGLFAIYILYREQKNIKYPSMLFLAMLIYTLLSYGCVKLGIISIYYFAKNYYILWIVGYILFFKCLLLMESKKAKATYGIFIATLILITISFVTNKSKLLDNIDGLNPYENITTISEIYAINRNIITESESDLTFEEIRLLEKATELIDMKDKNTLIVGSAEQMYWTYTLTGYSYTKNIKQLYLLEQSILQRVIDKNYENIIILNRNFSNQINKSIKSYINKVLENPVVLYKNEIGEIIKNEK